METRKTKKLLSIPVPFQLTAMEEQWPAGIYESRLRRKQSAISCLRPFDVLRPRYIFRPAPVTLAWDSSFRSIHPS